MSTADGSNPGHASADKPATLIHRGEHDSNVLKLQQQLHRLGYPIAQDGAFGPQTEAALRDAQAHAGVTPNGIAGPQTTLALGNLETQGYHADPHAMSAHHAPSHHAPSHHAPHEPLATEHLHAQQTANEAAHDHGAHHRGHAPHAPDADLGTLPFPTTSHDDPYKPAEEPHAAHDDPYKPAEEPHDPYAPVESHNAYADSHVEQHDAFAPAEEHHDAYATVEEHHDVYAAPDPDESTDAAY